MPRAHINGGGVVRVATESPGVFIDLVRRRGHQQRLSERIGQLQRQFRILLHVHQRLLDVLEVCGDDQFGFLLQERIGDGGQAEHLQYVLGRDAGTIGQGESFGQTGESDAFDHLEDEVHLGGEADVAQVEDGASDGFEARLALIEETFVAGAQDYEVGFVRLLFASL